MIVRINTRMPVIVRPEDERLWLDPEVTDVQAVRPLLQLQDQAKGEPMAERVAYAGSADGSAPARLSLYRVTTSFWEICTAKIERRRPPGWPDPILYRLRALLPICRPATAGASGTTGTTIVT